MSLLILLYMADGHIRLIISICSSVENIKKIVDAEGLGRWCIKLRSTGIMDFVHRTVF
jgi:hypothetical protein